MVEFNWERSAVNGATLSIFLISTQVTFFNMSISEKNEYFCLLIIQYFYLRKISVNCFMQEGEFLEAKWKVSLIMHLDQKES